MKSIVYTLVAALTLALFASAAQGVELNARQKIFKNEVANGRIVYFPLSYSLPLTRIWGEVMKKEAEALGIEFEIRDPDFDPQREQQMIAAMIPQQPDVMIVHNPNATILANVIKRAQQQGIYVIQVNMASNTRGDVFVGVNPLILGRKMGKAAVDACSGTNAPSHNVAIMQGVVTSAYNIGIQNGIMAVLKEHEQIKVVSDQAANWRSKIAYDKASTVLQAHSDLCAYIGRWSGMDRGIAQAVKEAGMKEQVAVITTGGGEPPICDYIRKGLIDVTFSYNAILQAHQMMAYAKFFMQTDQSPGSFHIVDYTPLQKVTKETVSADSCAPKAYVQ